MPNGMDTYAWKFHMYAWKKKWSDKKENIGNPWKRTSYHMLLQPVQNRKTEKRRKDEPFYLYCYNPNPKNPLNSLSRLKFEKGVPAKAHKHMISRQKNKMAKKSIPHKIPSVLTRIYSIIHYFHKHLNTLPFQQSTFHDLECQLDEWA